MISCKYNYDHYIKMISDELNKYLIKCHPLAKPNFIYSKEN